MTGLSAIAAANGWFITVTGLVIVFTGLALLAAFIASLDKLLAFWDRGVAWLQRPRRRESSGPAPGALAHQGPAPLPRADASARTVFLGGETLEVYQYFQWLTRRQGDVFSLSRLLEQAEKRGIPRPHFHLDELLVLGLIEELPGEECGFYRWTPGISVQPEE
ncbi:OadG family protein [Desulfosoma sp.]